MREIRSIFLFPPLGGVRWVSVVAGGGVHLVSEYAIGETPPYTLPGEGIAHPPCFLHLL